MNEPRTLTKGRKYNRSKWACAGWTNGDGSGHAGYDAWNYFAGDGRYLGPDKHGIEPLWVLEKANARLGGGIGE